MKADRRSFFKFGAGAAVAAPVAMKQVAGDAFSGGPVPPQMGRYVGGLASSETDAAYIKSELAEELKRLTALNKPTPEHDRFPEPVIAQRIDALRSVSAVNKARMMYEERDRVARLRERGWLLIRIERLKERLGPLGSMF